MSKFSITNLRMGTFIHFFPVHHLDPGVPEEAVPALGRMEKRVGVPDICTGKPDHPGEHPGARVRCKADHKLADKVVTGLHVVKRGQAVELYQFVIVRTALS